MIKNNPHINKQCKAFIINMITKYPHINKHLLELKQREASHSTVSDNGRNKRLTMDNDNKL